MLDKVSNFFLVTFRFTLVKVWLEGPHIDQDFSSFC